jgi:hypothetical protein
VGVHDWVFGGIGTQGRLRRRSSLLGYQSRGIFSVGRGGGGLNFVGTTRYFGGGVGGVPHFQGQENPTTVAEMILWCCDGSFGQVLGSSRVVDSPLDYVL